MSSTHSSRSSVLRQRDWQRRGKILFRYCVLVVVALLILIPFIWVVSLAFTNPAEAFSYPPHLIPQHPTLANFLGLLSGNTIPVALMNSIIVAGTATLTNIFFATLAGYAFARLQFPGRDHIFFVLIATTMVPGAVTLIPLFLLVKDFPLAGGNDLLGQGGTGLLNSLPGLMVPHIVQALNIFLARQFFMNQPEELAEAARVDGASEFLTFFRIYLPISKPMIATIAIIAFTGAWEDFLWPLVISTTPNNYTIQVALSSLAGIGGGGTVDWGPLMAATAVATLPLLLAFLFFQRYFIAGLTSGSVKG